MKKDNKMLMYASRNAMFDVSVKRTLQYCYSALKQNRLNDGSEKERVSFASFELKRSLSAQGSP